MDLIGKRLNETALQENCSEYYFGILFESQLLRGDCAEWGCAVTTIVTVQNPESQRKKNGILSQIAIKSIAQQKLLAI